MTETATLEKKFILDPGTTTNSINEVTVVEEVVVYGQRFQRTREVRDSDGFDVYGPGAYRWYGPNGLTAVNNTDTQALIDEALGGNNPDENVAGVPQVKIDLDPNHPDYDRAVEQAKELEDRAEALDPAIDGLSNIARVEMPDGKVTTGAELKNVWNKLEIRITANETGVAPVGDKFVSKTYVGRLNGYLAQEESGTNFFFFHELGHVTPQGLGTLDQWWSAYKASNPNWATQPWDVPGQESQEFKNNEMWANTWADNFADLVGVSADMLPPGPPFGYMPGS